MFEPIALYNKEIYAGGNFTKAQGAVIDANNAARWDGSKWDSVGSGADNEVWCMKCI